MLEKYKIIIDREGVNHVKGFKADDNGYSNHWNFPLKNDDEPIIFNDFYTESRFAIINWDGWVRLYDASIQKALLDHKLNGKVNSRAVLSLNKSKLYVAYTDDSSNHHLAIFDLSTYELQTLELPDIYGDSMEIRKDGCLLFYKHDWERINNKKVYRHFYSVLNPETQKQDQFELPYAAQFSYGEFKPVIDIENNRTIIPLYDDVPNKTSASGEVVFEYRIALFDLNTFEITHALSVRDFPINQLGCSESECEEMSELFQSSERDKDYYEASREFFENLTTIKIVPDGFWLCWRGGILRKIDSNLIMSPLLVTNTRPNNTVKGMFQHAHFHSHLYHIDNTTIVLAEALDFYKTAIPNIASVDFEIPIALQLETTSLDEIYNLNYSNDQKNEIENRDHILIEVKDLSDTKGNKEAILKIKTIISDLNAAGVGSRLSFLIKDTKGIALDESEFFNEAITYDPEGIKLLIETFIQHPKARYLHRNPEETALCHAAFELARLGDQYEATVFQYLAAIDMDHDVFNLENTIPALEEKYNPKELTQKMKVVSEELAEWFEGYYEG